MAELTAGLVLPAGSGEKFGEGVVGGDAESCEVVEVEVKGRETTESSV